jgi:AraC-like DNA-binding protein
MAGGRRKEERTAALGGVKRRETKISSDGAYTFRDELRIEGELSTTVLTGTAWLLEHFELASGRVSFSSGDTVVEAATNDFWVFYPPFTISRPRFVALRGTVRGIAGREGVPEKFERAPILFEAPLSMAEQSVANILARASNIRTIEANPRASSLSMKARKLIAEAHANDPSIARIAARLRVSNAHLSRQFRRDYGISPREYLHQVRIADVPLRLARGESIADVASSAGYGDLSRFYKQFNKATDASPGRCRKLLAPRKG